MRRALLVLSCLVLSACSASQPKTTAAPVGSSSATASASGGAVSTTTPQPGSGTSPGATAVSTSASATQQANGGAQASSAPGATQAPGKTPGTPAGTYTYDTSGTQTFSGASKDVSGSATLTVSAAKDGRQSSSLHNSQGDTTQELVVRDTGSYLAGLTISSPTVNKEFRFSPVALLLPQPAKAGASWSWRATSTDGTTTVSATNKVLRTETLTIGGEQVPTVVLQTHLVITGENLTYTADVTNWAAPAYRLPVKTHTTGSGSYGTFAFSFDVTDVLRSVHPA